MKFGKKTIALIGAVAMLSSVAACGSTSAGDSGSTGSSDKKIELTVWSWDSTLPRTVKGFEAKNPNIKVKVTNAGTNKDEYNALSNAIEAGSGAPDIAQIEYYALPEYVIRGHLENLSDLGASDFKDFYTPGTWSSVNINAVSACSLADGFVMSCHAANTAQTIFSKQDRKSTRLNSSHRL